MIIYTGTLLTMPPSVRTVVFVGNRSCDHLRELVRMAEFKGRMAYRIERATELQPRWFVGVEEVGVVVGAADLNLVVVEVRERLAQFARAEKQGMLGGLAV